MEIRELTKADVPSLLQLYSQLDSVNDSLELNQANSVWETIENSKLIKYFGAIDKGKVVSTCYCVIIPNITHFYSSICYIENVVTDKDYRLRGLGKQVIDRALSFAKQQNCYKAVLFSNSKRTEAHKFYKKIGFSSDSKIGFCMSL